MKIITNFEQPEPKSWGVTQSEAEQMFERGELKKTFLKNTYGEPYTVYYQESPDSKDYKKVCEVNNMGDFVLSEWVEFYDCRVDNLATQCNIINAIPIITKEECFACGL
jgi:hypothetical protein